MILETLFMSYRKMPFACGYLPGDLKTILPIAVAAFVFFTYQFAHIELAALRPARADFCRRARRDLPEPARHRRVPAPDARAFEFDEMPSRPRNVSA